MKNQKESADGPALKDILEAGVEAPHYDKLTRRDRTAAVESKEMLKRLRGLRGTSLLVEEPLESSPFDLFPNFHPFPPPNICTCVLV